MDANISFDALNARDILGRPGLRATFLIAGAEVSGTLDLTLPEGTRINNAEVLNVLQRRAHRVLRLLAESTKESDSTPEQLYRSDPQA